ARAAALHLRLASGARGFLFRRGEVTSHQIVRHIAKCPEHGRLRIGVAGARESDGACMTEYLPISFGGLDLARRARAFVGLAGGQTLLRQVERHCDKVSDLTHERASRYFLTSQSPTACSGVDPHQPDNASLPELESMQIIHVCNRRRPGRTSTAN